jgi:hypothetical protein
MGCDGLEPLQGTLDLMVLQALAGIGPLHGYGIVRRIEQVSGDQVLLNQGTIYGPLVRLQQQGWISAGWVSPIIIARPGFTPSPARPGSDWPGIRPFGEV